ncbi:hypothetical protein C8R43DRAFT_1108187 [Mycena crocata]|nr:hypothetical protein C8R43DRAFT_1108187 [Mycena crocata]
MAAPPPIHVFIPCPKEGCPEYIPQRLVCSGQKVPEHAGLEYQVCSLCGYFKWLAPDLYYAAERRRLGAPANGASPFPPPRPPFDPYARSPEAAQSPFALDPSLASMDYPTNVSTPTSNFTQPPSSQPVPASQSTKRSCSAVPRCGRVAGAQGCSFAMCKQCCERQNKGCRYSGHRKQQFIAPLSTSSSPSTDSDPSALSRPTPMFSYTGPSQSTPSDGSMPPKLYKKTMDPQWAQRYNANHTEQEKRRAAEEQRRQQELMLQNQVRFCFWGKDGVDPETFRLQGLGSLRLNLVDHLALLKKMELDVTDEIGIFNFDGRSWDREDVNHVMEVVPRQVILVRRFGVTDCPKLDESIVKYAPTKTTASRRAVYSTAPKRKRADRSLSEEPIPGPSKSARRPTAPARSSSPIYDIHDIPSSPSSRASSPSFPATPPPSDVPAPNVIIAEGCGNWPEGVYACDMAAAFRSIPPKDVSNGFMTFFGLKHFPKGAWYQQQRAWKACIQTERDEAKNLPRTFAGLWTEWRTNTQGWGVILAEKKREGKKHR